MSIATTSAPPSAKERGLLPQRLHHYARVTRDIEATADFYGRVLGLELCNSILDDHVPSTGDEFPYFHLFLRLGDGSTIAFFECTSLPPPPKSSHPAYDVFDHLALQSGSLEELARWKEWLLSQKVDVIGPVDHGIAHSIYFHDPNGYRLELSANVDPKWNDQPERAEKDLASWINTKRDAKAGGKDVSAALLSLIGARKRNRP